MNYSAFVGIDISKLAFDVHVHGQNLKMPFSNNQKGYKLMLKWLQKDHQIDLSNTMFCFEHTGIYSLNLALFLQTASLDFLLAPALEIKRSLGTTRGKSDQIDAARIAEYAYLNRERIKPTVLPSNTILKLQPLLTLRDNLVTHRAHYRALSGEQRKVFNLKEHQELFKTYQQLIKDLDKRIASLESSITAIINADESIQKSFQLLIGIKGIGPLTAAYLIIYTHNFTRFHNWRKFACYAGIAPFEHSSGSSIRGRTRVSHLANKHIKTLLFLAANNAVKYDPELKAYYQRRVEEGKSKMSTLNIIKNKLIARAFAVIKRQTAYVDLMKFAA